MENIWTVIISISATGAIALLGTWAKLVGDLARIKQRLDRLEDDRDEIKTLLREVQDFLHRLDKKIDRPR